MSKDIPLIEMNPPVNVYEIPEEEWDLYCDGQEIQSDFVDEDD